MDGNGMDNQLTPPEPVQNNKEDQISTTPCLICRQHVNSLGVDSHDPEILSKHFAVFSQHMHWDRSDDQEFDFRNELFPFCQHCKTVVVDIYSMHEQLQNISKNISELVLRATETIIASYSQTKDPALIPEGELNGLMDKRLGYNKNKVQFYRNATLARYLPAVRLKSEEEGGNSVDSPRSSETVLQEVNVDPNDILMPFSISAFGGEESNNASSNHHNHHHHQVITILDNDPPPKSRAAKNIGRPQHHENKKPRESRHFTTQVTENKFVYKGFTFDKLKDDILKCCHCEYFTSRRHHIIMHITRVHARYQGYDKQEMKAMKKAQKERIGLEGNKFQYKGFMFELESGVYYCCNCQYSSPSKSNTMQHIWRVHLRKGSKGATYRTKKKKTVKKVQKSFKRRAPPRRNASGLSEHAASKNPQKVESREVLVDNLMNGKFKDRVRQIDGWNFLVDDKFPIQLNVEGKWVCLTCEVIFSMRFNMERHIFNTCKGATPTIITRLLEKNKMPDLPLHMLASTSRQPEPVHVAHVAPPPPPPPVMAKNFSKPSHSQTLRSADLPVVIESTLKPTTLLENLNLIQTPAAAAAAAAAAAVSKKYMNPIVTPRSTPAPVTDPKPDMLLETLIHAAHGSRNYTKPPVAVKSTPAPDPLPKPDMFLENQIQGSTASKNYIKPPVPARSTPNPPVADPKPETLLENRINGIMQGRLKSQLQRTSEIGFVANNVHHFQLLSVPANTWLCLHCHYQFVGQFAMEEHVIMGCRGFQFAEGHRLEERERPFFGYI